MTYVPPSTEKTAFNCPSCGTFAHQRWYSACAELKDAATSPALIQLNQALEREKLEALASADLMRRLKKIDMPHVSAKPVEGATFDVTSVWFSSCAFCSHVAIWVDNRLVYPTHGSAPPPNPDTPEEIRPDYEEASSILDRSPRGAAALLRLCIQKLCKALGQPGKNLNEDIAALVKAGLGPQIQQALDVVRVIGNNALHPGEMNLKDDRATAETLFRLINLIIEKMISEPKQLDVLYKGLPEGALKAIEKRDGREEA